jgi:hypothetical protein
MKGGGWAVAGPKGKNHEKETCQDDKCRDTNCPKRHPKVCRNYAVNKKCMFKDNCAYKHIVEKTGKDVKIEHLENEVKLMKQKIEMLESALMEKLDNLEILVEKTLTDKGEVGVR